LEEFDEDCQFPIRDLSGASPRSIEDVKFSCNLSDIDDASDELDIPWEPLKDKDFAYVNPYIGIMWDLAQNKVYLDEDKKKKYLLAIEVWQNRSTHVLNDIQQLYGKLLHTTLVVPKGRAYLTSLEAMLCLAFDKPFLPRRPVKSLNSDLSWWKSLLRSSFVGRTIPRPLTLYNPEAYSDASSGVGIAITIGVKWRAWRLRKGWQTLNGKKDIGWAEAVGFELLIIYLVGMGGSQQHFKVFGDNQGVIEGWRNGRSRNSAVNEVFRRIFIFIDNSAASYSFHPTYVASKENPADDPSRGVYGSTKDLLPELPIPAALKPFIVDPFIASTDPRKYSTDEIQSIAPDTSALNSLNDTVEKDTGIISDALYHIHQRQQYPSELAL
jgi:hypothetical protein